jgi:hypothetical protein
MPPKVPVVIILKATTLQDKDTSIVENKSTTNSQMVTMGQLRQIVDQMNDNLQALNNKVSEIGMTKVKLPSIERFNSTKSRLKGFLLQMKFKIIQEDLKIGTLADQIAYTGLFLTGKALKWFKPYLTKIQTNKISTTNQKVRYIFSS